MSHKDVLFELGLEELPPKACWLLLSALKELTEEGLKSAGLSFDAVHAYMAPRRLALFVEKVSASTPEKRRVRKGPYMTQALDSDGKPTPAALGFARSCQMQFNELAKTQDEKGERLYHEFMQAGEVLEDLLPGILEKSLKRLPIPKAMRWGSNDISFVRPVHWVLLMCDKKALDVKILGVRAANITYGHRTMAPGAIEITSPKDYVEQLKTQGKVLVDAQERRNIIVEQAQTLAKQHNAQVVLNEALLDDVTALVAWPVALLGNYDPRFLRLPQEVLITVMASHQKYFHLVDDTQTLLPHFITVANIESKDPAEVIAGNERVMCARLSDADFFYETDLAVPLADRLPKLKHVLFQQQLGNLWYKSQRVIRLSAYLGDSIDVDQNHLNQVATLIKADLLTDMVGEFPSLQGYMGCAYAKAQGIDEAVANAIEQHYWPRFSKDRLPETMLAAVVAIADRMDTLMGLFAAGKIPTGDKDPFALRRAALGLVRIAIEHALPIDLKALATFAAEGYESIAIGEDCVDQVVMFCWERLRAWYQEQGVDVRHFNAVLATKPTEPMDFAQRIKAVSAFSQSPQAPALAESYKRISKLLAKSTLDPNVSATVQEQLFEEPAERALYASLQSLSAQNHDLLAKREYHQALQALIGLSSPLELFFAEVMVNTDDVKIRDNRLALLQSLRLLFAEVADLEVL